MVCHFGPPCRTNECTMCELVGPTRKQCRRTSAAALRAKPEPAPLRWAVVTDSVNSTTAATSAGAAADSCRAPRTSADEPGSGQSVVVVRRGAVRPPRTCLSPTATSRRTTRWRASSTRKGRGAPIWRHPAAWRHVRFDAVHHTTLNPFTADPVKSLHFAVLV